MIRVAAGYYEVVAGGRKVTIIRNPEMSGPAKWVAYAQWDKYFVTDPVCTLAEARACATLMLADER